MANPIFEKICVNKEILIALLILAQIIIDLYVLWEIMTIRIALADIYYSISSLWVALI